MHEGLGITGQRTLNRFIHERKKILNETKI